MGSELWTSSAGAAAGAAERTRRARRHHRRTAAARVHRLPSRAASGAKPSGPPFKARTGDTALATGVSDGRCACWRCSRQLDFADTIFACPGLAGSKFRGRSDPLCGRGASVEADAC